ncbi:MAG: hypothetical protein ACRD43_11205, partial [Pyrinomonadaceae bacterium]
YISVGPEKYAFFAKIGLFWRKIAEIFKNANFLTIIRLTNRAQVIILSNVPKIKGWDRTV